MMKSRDAHPTNHDALALNEIAIGIYCILRGNTNAAQDLKSKFDHALADSEHRFWSDHIHYFRSALLRFDVEASHRFAQAAYDEIRELVFDFYWDNAAPNFHISSMNTSQRNALVKFLLRKIVRDQQRKRING